MWKCLVLGCLVACALAASVPEQDQVFYKLSPEESGALEKESARYAEPQPAATEGFQEATQGEVVPYEEQLPNANDFERQAEVSAEKGAEVAAEEEEPRSEQDFYVEPGRSSGRPEERFVAPERERVVEIPEDVAQQERQRELAEVETELKRKLEISGGEEAVDALDQPMDDGYGYGGGGQGGGSHHGKGYRKHGSTSYGEGGGKKSYHDSGKGDHGYQENQHGEHHGKGGHRGQGKFDGGVKWYGGTKDSGGGKYGNHGSYSGQHTGKHHNKYHAGFGDKYKHQGERIKTYSYGGHGWYKEKTHGHVTGHGGQKGGEEGKHGGKYHGHDSSHYNPSYSNRGEDSGYRKHKGWN